MTRKPSCLISCSHWLPDETIGHGVDPKSKGQTRAAQIRQKGPQNTPPVEQCASHFACPTPWDTWDSGPVAPPKGTSQFHHFGEVPAGGTMCVPLCLSHAV